MKKLCFCCYINVYIQYDIKNKFSFRLQLTSPIFKPSPKTSRHKQTRFPPLPNVLNQVLPNISLTHRIFSSIWKCGTLQKNKKV